MFVKWTITNDQITIYNYNNQCVVVCVCVPKQVFQPFQLAHMNLKIRNVNIVLVHRTYSNMSTWAEDIRQNNCNWRNQIRSNEAMNMHCWTEKMRSFITKPYSKLEIKIVECGRLTTKPTETCQQILITSKSLDLALYSLHKNYLQLRIEQL